MTTLQISLLVVAALPLLYRAWSGWRYGATAEFRFALTFFFATLVAARYWEPLTETLRGSVTFDPRSVAVVSFLALFAAGVFVAGFVVELNAKVYQSVKPNYVDKALGLLAGIFSGALLGACILWVSAVARPTESLEGVESARALFDFPRQTIGFVETAVGMASDSSGRTRYPAVTVVEVKVENQPADIPAGSVLMQRRGQITWKQLSEF